jgi:hypothetical protein
MPPYSAKGKSPNEILADFESGAVAEQFGGNTAEYVQAALTASAAEVQRKAERTQQRWAKIATLSGGIGAGAAIAAVIVAALH